MTLATAFQAWRVLLGDDAVLDTDRATAAYATDCGTVARQVAGALRLTSADPLPELLRVAAAHGVPLHALSTGRNWGYGSALPSSDASVLVDLSAMQRIHHFDAELGVVTVEPGVTQGMLARFLAEGHHPFMVPTTGAGPDCSLIGNALERGYGITPHADHFGALTDIEAVLADGTRFRSALREAAGEQLSRLFRWGIGPYTSGLFAQGSFGIVTRASILLARRPARVECCLFSLRDDRLLEPAVGAVRQLLGSLPGLVGGINLMNQHRVLAMTAPYPPQHRGRAGTLPAELVAQMGRSHGILPWTGFISLFGTRRTVAAARHEIKRVLARTASRMIFVGPEFATRLRTAAGWIPGAAGKRLSGSAQTLASALELAGGTPNRTALPLVYWRHAEGPAAMRLRDPARDGCGLIWYAPLVPMRAGEVRDYVGMVKAVTVKHGIEPLVTLTSISDKLFDSSVPLLFDRQLPGAAARARDCLLELLETGRAAGFYPYRIGVDGMAQASAHFAEAAGVNERLATCFDPQRLLMPGRYTR